jgi:hypothetical protein
LAEALTTHGAALARLNNYNQACASLQRAIEAAQQAGAPCGEAEAELKAVNERLAISSDCLLGEDILHYEREKVKQALVQAGGRISHV